MHITFDSAEQAMDWLDFIASLVGSVAWPIAAVTIAGFFRKQIAGLLDKIKSVSWGDAKADFTDALDTVEERSDPLPLVIELDHVPASSQQFERLLAISPAAAVLDVWRTVERELYSSAEMLDVDPKYRFNNLKLLDLLVSKGVLDDGSANILRDLRGLRNVAAHHSDREISASDAFRFKELADRVLVVLRSRR